MEYESLVHDFARRTRANLQTIQRLSETGGEGPVYEVTQLVNSLLGLLIFPQQKLFAFIPEISLSELQADGWPVPRVTGDFAQVWDLRQLVRYLRNAIAHCNVRFSADSRGNLN